MRVLFSPSSVQDLREIRDYIAKDNVVAAHELLHDIDTLCSQLGRQPELGTARNDLQNGLRMFTVRRYYVVLYQISADAVQILRIVHSSRDFNRLF